MISPAKRRCRKLIGPPDQTGVARVTLLPITTTLQEAGSGDPIMSVANSIIVYSLLALAYLVTPAALIGGWVRWSRRTDVRTPATTASLISFALASSSAALAAFTLVLAQFHHFGFYDPVLMRIYGSGAVLSSLSALLALIGVWRRNLLRLVCACLCCGHTGFLDHGGGGRVAVRAYPSRKTAFSATSTLPPWFPDVAKTGLVEPIVLRASVDWRRISGLSSNLCNPWGLERGQHPALPDEDR